MIASAQGGDADSFNRLIELYQGLVYNTAYRILGEREAAEDATQEAFLSAFQNIARFRGGSFKAWLLRIVTNACYDQLRRKQRRPTASLEALLVEGGDLFAFTDRTESPEEYTDHRELGRAIQAGLATLPADQRITLVLSDIQGLSYQEIAQATGTSLGTVKSRLSRARAAVRDYLLAHEEELLPWRYRLKGE